MKKSVYISKDTVAAINARYNDGDQNYSEAINMFSDRYRVMVRADLAGIELTTDEWTMLFDIYNGTLTRQDAEGAAKMLLAEVADSYRARKLPGLQDKVAAMNLAQRMAVIDVIDRFWAGDWSEAGSYDAIIDELLNTV
jgi:hypothetical protein